MTYGLALVLDTNMRILKSWFAEAQVLSAQNAVTLDGEVQRPMPHRMPISLIFRDVPQFRFQLHAKHGMPPNSGEILPSWTCDKYLRCLCHALIS